MMNLRIFGFGLPSDRMAIPLIGRLKLLAVGFLFASLFGCGNEPPEKLLASAKEYLARNEPRSAIIQLKTALLENPTLAEARFLLGKTLLDSGDPGSASLELSKAADLKYPPDAVDPLLAQALLQQGEYKKVTARYASVTLGTPEANADLKTSVANAFAMLGEYEQATLALDGALLEVPDYAPAQIARVRLMATKKDFDGALNLIEKILLKAPDNNEAWQLKGSLLAQHKHDAVGAITAYKTALSTEKDDVFSHFGITELLLQQKELDEAAAQIGEMTKELPNDPRTKYLQALLAFQKGQFKTARELIQKVLAVAPEDLGVLQLAGAVELELRSFSQADKLLRKAQQLAPDSRRTQWLLAHTYLRSDQPEKALTVLHPVIEKDEPDPRWLALFGEVYRRNGDNDKADEYFARAVKLNPDDSNSRTALALSQLSKGNHKKAIGELQAIASSGSVTYADLALINVYLQRKEFDSAMRAIDNLERKQPGTPSAAFFRGTAKLVQGDTAAARKNFERALAMNPAYFPAASRLAALDFADGQPELAKKRFEGVLKVDAENTRALLAIADLRERAGGSKDEVAGLITKAVTLNPTQVSPRLRLVDYYLKLKDSKSALAAAQAAVAALPDSPDLLAALGRAQMATGDLNQAISSYNKLVALQPQSPQAHLSLAEAHKARKDNDSAIKSLRRALEITPDLVVAQRLLIAAEIVAGNPQEALAIARTVQKQRPDDSIGLLLEGKVELLKNNFDAAVAAFSAGLKKKTVSTELASALHGALIAAQRRTEADGFAAEWLKEHSTDDEFLVHLGGVALFQANYLLAETRYRDVLSRKPDHVETLNNLAIVLTTLKKPGAVGYAQKANDLRPNQPAIMDTLAMALAQENKTAQAAEVLEKALELQPEYHLLRINLAKIYIQAGKKSLARSELDRLAKLGDKFPQQAEVSRLLKAL